MQHGIVTDWNDMEQIWNVSMTTSLDKLILFSLSQFLYSKDQLKAQAEDVCGSKMCSCKSRCN